MKADTILGCYGFAARTAANLVGSILMSVAIFNIIAALEPDNPAWYEGISLGVYVLSIGFFVYFIMCSFVLEAAFKAMKEDSIPRFYQACIASLLLLPFMVTLLTNYLFFAALAASIMIFCFSWLINKLRA